MNDDLISRHGVSAWLDNIGHPELADVVMDEKRFTPAQPEQQWIPCSERLPEPYVKVLVSDVDGDVCFAWFEDHWGEWWSDRYGIIEVLAWMPLPESYKGEKHE